MDNTAKEFWEKKILNWENSRYARALALYPLTWTIRQRLAQSREFIINRTPKDQSILELGCGSGYLAESLTNHAGNYLGIDLAECAIKEARRRIKSPYFRFEAGDVLNFPLPPADLTVFLGLTDWLSHEGLKELFASLRTKQMLFSFTEPAAWNPYRAYRLYMDGVPAKDKYRAQNHSAAAIMPMLDENGFAAEIIQKPNLINPGGLIWATAINNA